MRRTPHTTYQLTQGRGFTQASCRNQGCTWTASSAIATRLQTEMANHADAHRCGTVRKGAIR